MTEKKVSVPFPATLNELLPYRKTHAAIDWNNHCEGLLKACLVEQNGKFSRWLDAMTNAEAIEGKIILDHSQAARDMRDLDHANGAPFGGKPLSDYIRGIGVVQRRYGMDHRSREATVNKIK